jgi:four helix bundle protein
MQNEDGERRNLRLRTKRFALRNIRVFAAIKKSDDVGRVLGRQLLRSGTSVGAHYREACRAKSVADFVSKMEGGLQELDETSYWLELLVESGNLSAKRLDPLLTESNELTSIFVSSVKSAKKRRDG